MTVQILSRIYDTDVRRRIFRDAFIIYLAELIIYSSVYGKIDSLAAFFAAVRTFAYLLICLKLILDFLAGAFSPREVGIVGVISFFLLFTAVSTGNKALLIYWAFIVAAHDTNFRDIIKWSCLVHISCILFVIMSSYAGLIENRLYGSSSRIRESLGFQYTTEASNYFFYTILCWIYCRREKISFAELAGLFSFSVFLFAHTDTKSAFAVGSLILTGALILKLCPFLGIYHRIYTIAAVTAAPLAAIGIFRLSVYYDSAVRWMSDFNSLISNRLNLGHSAYRTYGVSLWGRAIEWVGGTEKWYEESTKVYNYVDSSFMQLLLNMGLVFLLALVLMLVALGLRSARKKDTYMLLVFFGFTLHATFDPQIIMMEFNSFVMLYSYFIDKNEYDAIYLDHKPQIYGGKRRLSEIFPVVERYANCLRGLNFSGFGNSLPRAIGHYAPGAFCMLLFALIFARVGLSKISDLSYRDAREEAMLTEYEQQISEYEKEIADTRENLALAETQRDELQAYVDDSVYMRLDGENIPYVTATYEIGARTGEGEDAPDTGNIAKSLQTFINAGGWLGDLYPLDGSAGYLSELTSSSVSGSVLTILVMHTDPAETVKIMNNMGESVRREAALLFGSDEKLYINKMTQKSGIRSDPDVDAAQKKNTDNLESYENNVSELSEKLETLRTAMAEFEESGAPKTYKEAHGALLLIQYTAVGLLFGAAIYAALLSLCRVFIEWPGTPGKVI